MPAITTDAVLFGLNDAKVSPLATDLTTAPTYGTAMDCPGVSTLSAQPIMENKENRGDGVILHTTSRMVGMDIEFKVAMLPLAMLPMIQGGTITSGGVTPAGKQTYSLKQTDAGPQYFKIEGVWDRLEAHLSMNGPYLLGEFSGADLLLTMLMRWSRNMPRPATEWPSLKVLADLVRARESWKKVYAVEGLTEW